MYWILQCPILVYFNFVGVVVDNGHGQWAMDIIIQTAKYETEEIYFRQKRIFML